ncbi:serine/threonine-protein kinase Nek1 isoform X7 [Synchiropus splendidus]|uniref:serine/threonine-protein kinase Nek1 isoform X7 n=1 Tax=Synchiropus splendidus TaxID=270530 RepID=UPI00237E2E9C|nr:serine/threonine-protein kinase Nek1 isoform X7 [Synchiropus splendidus]
MDKYEKIRKIGQGSFGRATLVKSKTDGRNYVIKEICISGMSSKERQESRNEVAVLANMSHPNIVQYKESFEEGGSLYIVMDYCEGGDLFKKINSQKGVQFPEEQILDWFVQICLALKHVHDRKILHRDIKSQNIFLTKEGTVQLGDFGIARVLNSTVELARTCIGTPYYLSPEICENKPYNNKSDIWALGCVLYEMCTLKHAFEAGNMKNLVLKIIRGTYPPVSIHYSHDLRSLLALLFKRNPRERPSVCSILDKPFLSCRIQKFLTPQIIAQEFRPLVLHKKAVVSGTKGQAAKRPASGCVSVSPAQRITTPASKYGVPVNMKKVTDATKNPGDRKPSQKPKMAVLPAAAQRRLRQLEEERKKQEESIRRKRMEQIEKERKRERALVLKVEQMKRYEKEKINRINQAREQGWKHVLSSSGGSSPERKCFVGVRKKTPVVSAGPAQGPIPVPGQSQSPFEQYPVATAQPQSKDGSKQGSSAAAPRSVSADVASAEPGPGPSRLLNSDVIKRELQRLQHVSKQAHISRQRGHMAVERSYQVEEFLQRKREAMLNKVRAEGQLGARHNLAAIYGRGGSVRCRRPKVNKEEEEYLARLRQIRLQNFNERQKIKAQLRGEKYDSDGSDSQVSNESAEIRRKRMEAVRAQMNARAAVLREQLELKKKEEKEREKRVWEEHMTPLKNTFQSSASAVQCEKKQILRRLNQNLKSQSPDEATLSAPSQPSEMEQKPHEEQCVLSNGDRKKWDVSVLPVLPIAQKTLLETCCTVTTTGVPPEDRPSCDGDRRKWEPGTPLVLAQKTLLDTCIITREPTAEEMVLLGALKSEVPDKDVAVVPKSQLHRSINVTQTQPFGEVEEQVHISQDVSGLPNQNASAGVVKTSLPEIVPETDASTSVQNPEVQKDQSPSICQLQTPECLLVPSDTTEIQDFESVVLENDLKQVSHQAAAVVAWEKEAHQPLPTDGATSSAVNDVGETGEERILAEPSAPVQCEEPLFIKLCSPAHRRAAVLGILSTQSSMEESSSSLASRSRSVSPVRSKDHNAFLFDLSTGMFDANNPKMLRTCSLPDLSRVYSQPPQSARATEPTVAPEVNNLDIEDLDDAAKEEDQSETEDAYEDEDLQDIRASMERLLQEDLIQTSTEVEPGDYNPRDNEAQEQCDNNGSDNELDDNHMVLDGDDAVENDDVDDQDMEEDNPNEEVDQDDGDEEDCSNGTPEYEEDLLTNGVEGENPSNESQVHEEWISDGSEEDHEAEAQHCDSIFSRLEELRYNLEQQMGFEKLIKAYNKIKAIHEDEDETIDQASSLVLNILGTEHQHLYPNILHLVMADGAYEEGNE